MLNDPPPEKKNRRPHPLEQRMDDIRNAAQETEEGNRRVMLHIPVAKPRLTYVLIGINAAIFVIAFFVLSEFQRNDLYNWGASNQFFVLQQGEFHRLLTAMFLHGGIAHVVFNMLALYYIGQNVERFFGTLRFALIYFLGGLAGSVLSVLLNDAQTFSVGASGAVFAIVGAELVFLYQHRKLFGDMAKAQLRNLLFIAVINLGVGFASNATTGGVAIDNWGHIGGLIGGVALAWFITPILIPKRHPVNENALTIEDINPLEKRYQQLVIYVSVLLAALIAGVLFIS